MKTDTPHAKPSRVRPLGACAVYIATIAAANWATSEFGLIHVGSIAVTAGTFAAGLSFVARDAVHEAAGRRWVLAAIVVGAALSGVLSPVQLAAASGVTFLVSELADMAVYTPLRQRTRLGAWIASNVVAAPIDSLLFLTLAGFPIGGWWGQTLVKAAVGVVTPLLLAPLLRRRGEATRAVLRHRLDGSGA